MGIRAISVNQDRKEGLQSHGHKIQLLNLRLKFVGPLTMCSLPAAPGQASELRGPYKALSCLFQLERRDQQVAATCFLPNFNTHPTHAS